MSKHPVTHDNLRRRQDAAHMLRTLLDRQVLDVFANEHLQAALDAINTLDSRSSNRDHTDAFAHATKHLAYAFRLRMER